MQDFDVGERFHDPGLAQRALNGSYIYYEGQPYFLCLATGRDYKANLYKIGDMTYKTLKVIDVQKDPLLDMSAPILGWMNAPNGDCYYITRRPNRQWKQGLSEEHCSYWSILGRMWQRCGRDMFKCQNFEDTMNEKYPSYPEVERRMKESAFFTCLAFSQIFACSKNALWHKSDIIGEFNPETDEWTIIPEFLTPTTQDYLEFLGLKIAK